MPDSGARRALLGRHYLGDVVAGVLVGACCAAAIAQASAATRSLRRLGCRSLLTRAPTTRLNPCIPVYCSLIGLGKFYLQSRIVLCFDRFEDVARSFQHVLLGRKSQRMQVQTYPPSTDLVVIMAQGSWDTVDFLVPQEASQRWFHAAAGQLSQIRWPVSLDRMYQRL